MNNYKIKYNLKEQLVLQYNVKYVTIKLFI